MHVLPADPLSKSASVSVVLFDFAFAGQVIDECGNNAVEVDCCECDPFCPFSFVLMANDSSTFVA
jgi:hypothetical protein